MIKNKKHFKGQILLISISIPSNRNYLWVTSDITLRQLTGNISLIIYKKIIRQFIEEYLEKSEINFELNNVWRPVKGYDTNIIDLL